MTPPPLRDRLVGVVTRERREARRPVPAGRRRVAAIGNRYVAGLAALAALVIVVLLPSDRDRSDNPWQDAISALVADHAREAHHEAIMTSDAGAARDWQRTRVAFAVHVPEISGVVLERADTCQLNGLRACLLRYRVNGHTVSYYSYRLASAVAPHDAAAATPFRARCRTPDIAS